MSHGSKCRYRSTLFQKMTCCLVTLSHYLDEYYPSSVWYLVISSMTVSESISQLKGIALNKHLWILTDFPCMLLDGVLPASWVHIDFLSNWNNDNNNNKLKQKCFNFPCSSICDRVYLGFNVFACQELHIIYFIIHKLSLFVVMVFHRCSTALAFTNLDDPPCMSVCLWYAFMALLFYRKVIWLDMKILWSH